MFSWNYFPNESRYFAHQLHLFDVWSKKQKDKTGLNHHIRLRVVSFRNNESKLRWTVSNVSQQFQQRDKYSVLCYIFGLEEFKDRTHTGWQVQQSRLHVYWWEHMVVQATAAHYVGSQNHSKSWIVDIKHLNHYNRNKLSSGWNSFFTLTSALLNF